MASTNDSADVTTSAVTGNALIDGLLTEFHWSVSARVNFQFTIPDSETDYEDTRDFLIDDYPDDNYVYVTAMPVFMVNAIRLGIAEFNNILNFAVTENADNNADTQLRYGLITQDDNDDPDPPGYAWTPQDDSGLLEWDNWKSGDMFFNTSDFGTADLIGGAPFTSMVGTYQYHTILHETGHALGLKHGHTVGEDTGNPVLPAAFDSMEFTVMTYRGYVGDVTDTGYEVRNGDYAQTLMMLDIQALQHNYGADFTTRSTDTVYRWDTSGRYFINGAQQWNTDQNTIFLTIWDGGGVDTYDFSGFTTAQNVDLAPGKWSNLGAQLAQLGATPSAPNQTARGNVFNALQYNNDVRSLIENAIGGSMGDTMSGNIAANGLDGGGGADILNGLGGNDVLTGGTGADQINGGDGYDTAAYTSSVGETVTLTPTGAPASGNWTVSGPSQASGDVLTGIEAFRFGTGSDDVTLGGPVGGSWTITLDGNDGDDILRGSTGAEILIGGLGTDTLRPGEGRFDAFGGARIGTSNEWIESSAQNDYLILDRATAATGYNFTYFTGTFSGSDLSTARGITRVNFAGSAFNDRVDGASGNDILRGNLGHDQLYGNFGHDTLEGGDGTDSLFGGDGNDTLRGGLGADSIFGGLGNDHIETGGGGESSFGEEGDDTIIGSADGERMLGGTQNDRIEGLGGADELDGGDGNDILLGGDGDDNFFPGLGIDTMDGGTGANDRMYMDRRTLSAAHTFALNGGPGNDGTSAINMDWMIYYAGSGGDHITGHDGNDIIYGYGGHDTLIGGAGIDSLDGGEGDDTLLGGLGADSLVGGNGKDRIETGGGGESSFGGAGDDTIIGSADGERMLGGADNDRLEGFGGADELDGGDGNDILLGGDGDDNFFPGLGIDTMDGGTGANDRMYMDRRTLSAAHTFALNGGPGNDGTSAINMDWMIYYAGSGGDHITGHDGNDIIYGYGGHDTLIGGAGIDSLDGGEGDDTLLGGLGADSLVGGNGKDRIETGGGGESSFGGAGDDTIIGSADGERMLGGADNDRLEGFGGADELDGGDGNDILLGGDGDDNFFPGLGVDTMDGGTGANDRMYMDRRTLSAAHTFALNGPVGSDGSSAINIDWMIYYAGSGNDRITGHDGNDIIYGYGGHDTLIGGAGIDTLDGGEGDDTLLGGLGFDSLVGGNGKDRIETGGGSETAFGGAGDDTLIGADDAERLLGGLDNDWLEGRGGADELVGDAGSDLLRGGAGADRLDGGDGIDTASYLDALARVKVALDLSFAFEGDALGDTFILIERLVGSTFGDVLRGDGGDNRITGYDGADTLQGMGGNDTIHGGAGSDALTGGLGNDGFEYTAVTQGGDTIKDFHNLAGDNDSLRFTGTAFGALPAGALAANRFLANTTGLASNSTQRFIYETDTGVLRYDSNGSGAGGVTAIATFTGAPALSAVDFLII